MKFRDFQNFAFLEKYRRYLSIMTYYIFFSIKITKFKLAQF